MSSPTNAITVKNAPRRGLPDPMYGSARPADQPPFCCFVPRGLKNASIGVDIEPIPIGESSSAPRSDRRSGPVGSCARQLRGQHPPQSLGARSRHAVEQLANDAGLAAAYLGLGRRGFGVHGDKRSRAAADFFLRRSPGPTYCSRRHQFVSSPALSHAFFQRLIALSIGSPGATRTSLTTAPASRHRSHRTMAVRTPPRSLHELFAALTDLARRRCERYSRNAQSRRSRDLLGASLESPRSAAWHRSAKAV